MPVTGTLTATPEVAAVDPLRDLGVRRLPDGGAEARVFSANATSIELCLLSDRDPNWIERSVRMRRDEHGVWTGRSRHLVPGQRYAIRANGPAGPRHAFSPETFLLDPYARGLVRVDNDIWRGVILDDGFDWGGVPKPRTPLESTVIYETHVKGLTKQLRSVPPQLRGTYAGLAHESTIASLKDLGVTAAEP